jgi:mannose-6-phosphate isomerase-like protein (cupin superfamily)
VAARPRNAAVRLLTLPLLALALACRCAAADPPQPGRTRLWTGAALQSLDGTLARSGAPYTQLIKGRTYGALLLRRAVSGSPELHAKLNDFFVVLSGAAQIEVGGRVTGARTVAPDEELGRTLTGGTLHTVGQGDVLFVPANHWLQVRVAKGQVVRALIIKTQ